MAEERLMNKAWLAHHGILGQKWGKMQGPPYPLDEEDHSAKERKEGWKKSLDGKNEELYDRDDKKKYSSDTNKARKSVEDAKSAFNNSRGADRKKAKQELKYAKEDLKNEQIKEKLNRENKVSKRRQALQEEYKKQGMSDEEAAVAAYKREKTEKILITAGVLTTAAIAAMVAKNQYDKVADKVIDGNVTLHNISTDSNKGVENAFYAAFNSNDRMKYRGMYGKGMHDKGEDVFDTAIEIKDKIKVASRKSGSRILKEMTESDSDFKKQITEQIETLHKQSNGIFGGGFGEKQKQMIEKAHNSIKRGIVDDNVFDAVNFGHVAHDPKGQAINDRVFGELAKRGYGAVIDVNDKWLSGYDTKNPIIVFAGASKLKVKDVAKLDSAKLGNDAVMANLQIYGKQLAPSLLLTTGAIAGGAAAKKSTDSIQNRRSEVDFVKKYRKEHPGTNLSYTEIARMRERKLANKK